LILYEHAITLKPGKELTLGFLGDIHWNLDESDTDLFNSAIKHLADRKKAGPVRIIGLGDYMDPFSTSERERIRTVHDTTLKKLDEDLLALTHDFYLSLMALQGCFLGLHEGHHYWEFQSRKTKGPKGEPLFMVRNTEYLCGLLRTHYFGVVARGTLLINGEPFKIMSTHGFGFSRTENGQILKRKRMAEKWRGNVYVQGHDHQLFIRRGLSKDDDTKKLLTRTQYYIASGSYLDGYPTDTIHKNAKSDLPVKLVGDPYGTYIEGKLYDPPLLGSAILYVSVNTKGELVVKSEEFSG